jgi:hypothetical protein
MARARQWAQKEITYIQECASIVATRAVKSDPDNRGEIVPGDLPVGCLKFAAKIVVMRIEPEFVLAYPTFTWPAYSRHCNEMCVSPNVSAYNCMVTRYNSWFYEDGQNEGLWGGHENSSHRVPEIAPANAIEHPYREQDMEEWWRVREARGELNRSVDGEAGGDESSAAAGKEEACSNREAEGGADGNANAVDLDLRDSEDGRRAQQDQEEEERELTEKEVAYNAGWSDPALDMQTQSGTGNTGQ